MESISGPTVRGNKLWLFVGEGREGQKEGRKEGGKDGRKKVDKTASERSDLSAEPIYHLDKMVAFMFSC